MEINEFKQEFKQKIKLLNITVSEEQIQQFYEYMQLLIEKNKSMNLTAIIEPKEMIVKHFVDSLSINQYIDKNDNFIDIGTGAGFPGIPLKIMNSGLKVTLADSLNKRIHFLQEITGKLKLENVECIHARAEELGQNSKCREKYTVVTSRAVAELSVLLEYMLPLTKIGGTCICMKGPNIQDKLESANNAVEILGGKVQKIEEFILPETDIKRTIIIIRKKFFTPSKYPRKAGLPRKQPIK